MTLEITVSNAVNLPNVERLGKIDPYVSVDFKSRNSSLRENFYTDRPIFTNVIMFIYYEIVNILPQ